MSLSEIQRKGRIMRLIDADALIEKFSDLRAIYSCFDEEERFYYTMYSSVINLIEHEPMIDACPYYHHEPTGEPFCEKDDRRHGEWLELNDPDAILENYYVCNQCGRMSNYNSNYCPNCGAKMDGGEQ